MQKNIYALYFSVPGNPASLLIRCRERAEHLVQVSVVAKCMLGLFFIYNIRLSRFLLSSAYRMITGVDFLRRSIRESLISCTPPSIILIFLTPLLSLIRLERNCSMRTHFPARIASAIVYFIRYVYHFLFYFLNAR